MLFETITGNTDVSDASIVPDMRQYRNIQRTFFDNVSNIVQVCYQAWYNERGFIALAGGLMVEDKDTRSHRTGYCCFIAEKRKS